MPLSCQIFAKINDFIKSYRRFDSKSFDDLFRAFPEIEKNTLSSILHDYVKNRTMINSKRVKIEIKEIIELYNEMIKEGRSGIFVSIGEKYEVSPIYIARQVVDYLEIKEVKRTSLCKTLIWDSSLIKDAALAYEVHLASLFDSAYSQMANIVATLNGKEHEMYLQSCLCSHGVAFKTEDNLRTLNFAKTPDILLDVPIAVDDFVINWIESKAIFGNEALHKGYVQQQYKHYLRYGPGLVIYWFGFLESIKSIKKSLVIYDHFPKKIVKICA